MANNNIDLAQPEADAVQSHQIPGDASARLSFEPSAVETFHLGEAGELVITFDNGGQLVISNFADFTDQGNLLYLADGTLIDPSVLTVSPRAPQDFSIANSAENVGAIQIAQPAPNTKAEINIQPGQKYVCDFDPANAATVEVKDGQMVLTFADGSQVVINNYSDVMAGDLPAELTVADGMVITEEELLTTVTEVDQPAEEELEVVEEEQAEKVAKVEPAAGEDLDSVAEALAQVEPAAGENGAVGNTGYGFNSQPNNEPLNGPDAIGPLGPTALRYGIPQTEGDVALLAQTQQSTDDRPAFDVDPASLDETNLLAGNLVATGNVNVSYGNDGPGTITPNGSFIATGQVDNSILASNGVPIIVTPTATGYVGMAGAVTIFDFTIDPVLGEYVYTQYEQIDHADPTNDNEIIFLNFGIQAEDADGDITTTNVRVAVADDAPVVTSQITKVVDETNMVGGVVSTTGQFYTDVGQDTPGTFAGTDQFNATGSMTGGNLTSNGVPVDVTFDPGTHTYTGTAGITTVFTVVIDPVTGSYAFNLFEPLDHADGTAPNDEILLNFGMSITDYDGDTESGFVTVRVLDDVPVTGDDSNTIDESNLDLGPIVVNDSVSVDFGEDGPGTLLPSGTFTPSGSLDNGTLSHNGVAIIVTPTANGYVGMAGATTVFTLDINPTTGAYTFTLNENLDHANDADPDDIIILTFGTTISDYDTDTEGGQIVINVKDDAPEFQSQGPQPDQGLETVDETNLGPIVETGTLVADFGEDNPGTYAGTDSFTPSGSMTGGNLTSHGFPVDVTFDSGTNTYTGVANGVPVFTLLINETTGEYTYTQHGVFDHADGTHPNDVITLTFGVDALDSEGEAAHGSIVINVLDDAPTLDPSLNTVDETDLGPVVVNGSAAADFGHDGASATTPYVPTGDFASSGSQLGGNLTQNGVPVDVTFDPGTNTYTGVAGINTVFTMLINNDGTYTFTLLGPLDHADATNPNDIINLDFGVEAVDYDGDSAENFIRIHVKDDVPTIGDSRGDVDETNFDQGFLEYQDTLVHNAGLDLASVIANDVFTSSTPLTVGGVPVVVIQSGNVYEGKVGLGTAFELTIDPVTGDYHYTQYLPLDHPDSNDHNDIITLNFGVIITDTDSDSDDGVITIDVADDGPDAVNDINTAEEAQLITGDVIANDHLSEDDVNTVTNVRFNGTDYPVSSGVPAVIVTALGTLTLNSDGTYQYIANNSDPDGTDVFTYTLTDRDGDHDTATLSIQVSPDGQPAAVSELLAVDETNLTPGPMIFNGTFTVDFGTDGAGTVTPNNSFTASGSLLGGNLTSGGVPVDVNLVGDTYVATAGATTIFTVQVNLDGTYTFQLFERIDHADATDPNDIITMEFGVTATDSDGDETDGTFTIHVHDDAPVAYDDGQTVLNEGQTVNGNVTNNDELSEDTPSPVADVIFNGTTTPVPAVGSVDINGLYGVLTISASGVYSYTANNNDPDGTDTFTYVLQDYDGDRDTAEISFKVNPLDDSPIITQPAIEVVDDTNLVGGPNVETGTITVNYGNDGPGEVNPNGTFTHSETALTACGETINVTLAGNTYTGTTTPGGLVIFTMEILENGNYTFTQFEAIDHADTLDHNDALMLNFGFTAQDSDDDTASSTLRVRVRDDGPEIEQVAHPVDESDLAGGPLVANGTVAHSFGEDGPGEITANGLFEAKFQMTGAPVSLSSGGAPITITSTANGYVGMIGAVTAFTLDINPATGAYTYTQYEPIDHPDDTDPDDVIWLKFYVDITDCDGDTDTGIIIIDVHDDGPTAVDDADTVGKNATTTTGNVLDNDDFGVDDGPNARLVDPGTFNGTYGTLVLNANGSYTYTRNGQPGGVDTFDYTIRDHDGDTDTATLTIDVKEDQNPINISGSGETDDTALASGPDVETGNINVNYQGDGPGTTTGNGNFSSGGNQLGSLSHNGTNINVTFNAGNNTYTGKAGAVTVFTMVINANGTYKFTQHENLDHSNTSSNNEALNLNFGVTATDNDGDTGNGTVTITVRDDGPNAANDSASIGKNGNSANGNVLDNDDVGEDDGSNVRVTTSGTFNGTYGQLVLNSNGSYTYTRYGKDGGTDTFNYTMRDHDGDTDTAKLTINVTEGPNGVPKAKDDRITEANKVGPYKYEGSILDNDSFGSDGAGSPKITSGVGTYNFPHGTLKIKANGTYVLTLDPKVTYNHNYELNYTIQDADGDTSSAVLRFYVTPLVLDLDGDGVELTDTANGVLFDYDNDGVAEQTAWVGSDDGFLVQDRNGDGVINNRSEMFGDMFGHAGGFSHLGSLDSNNDGFITNADAEWSDLKVWRDINQDGYSDANELFTLDDLGIDSINLSSETRDDVIHNNYISEGSSYTTTDGETHEIVDVHFEYEDDDVDLSQYLVDESDDLVTAAINQAAETLDADHPLNSISQEDVLFMVDDQTDAINDFVFAQQNGDGEGGNGLGNVNDNDAPQAAALEGLNADVPLYNNGEIIV